MMEETPRLINQVPSQVIAIALGSFLIAGLQGCTWIASLGVSEKGKERCLRNINSTDNSFVSELSFRKCIKNVDTTLATEEKTRLEIADASRNPTYIKQWAADRQKLNLALKYDDKGCDKNPESVPEDSLELSRSQCKGVVQSLIKPLKDDISSQCSMISEFESWYEWAILSNRRGACDELMQKEIQDKELTQIQN